MFLSGLTVATSAFKIVAGMFIRKNVRATFPGLSPKNNQLFSPSILMTLSPLNFVTGPERSDSLRCYSIASFSVRSFFYPSYDSEFKSFRASTELSELFFC